MRNHLLSIVSLTALAAPGAALAQINDPGASQGALSSDIVVTARRREERLQDVPIAVTAVDSAALDSRGLDNVTQIGSDRAQHPVHAGSGRQFGRHRAVHTRRWRK